MENDALCNMGFQGFYIKPTFFSTLKYISGKYNIIYFIWNVW